ncbi:MAG: DUF2628 domain-containing protein [Pseudomonadota bacterium]|nr:DUF2628 domain-containing protein [Pseudomonadota bacterium]
MKTYKVLNHKTKELQAVKSGIAWLAIPFFPFWFLFRRLWMIFLLYILIFIILASIDYEIYGLDGWIFNLSSKPNDLQILIFIADVVILALPAFKGNEWTINKLQRKGYKISYSVQASSKKEALKIALNKKIDQDLVN